MIVGWTLLCSSAALVYLLMRSPWGRVLKSIREDEDAVRSLGKNVYSYKMQALVLGGVIGAMAGIMSGLATTSRPVGLRDRHDVLHLHRDADRRRRPGVRPGRRCADLLVLHQRSRPVLRQDDQRPTRRFRHRS